MMRTERNKEEFKQQRNKPDSSHIPDSSTDHQDEVEEGNGVSSDLTFVRGTTTQFKEVAHNTEEDEGTKKVSARSLSVSKSGRCKNRNQYRIKMPSEEIYIDSKSNTTVPSSGSTDSPSLSSRKKKDARLERTQKTDLNDSFTFSSQENLTSIVEESSKKPSATPEMKSPSPLSPSSPAAKRPTNTNLSTLKASTTNKSKDAKSVEKEAAKQSSDDISKTIKNSSEKSMPNNASEVDKTKPVVLDKKKADSKHRKEREDKIQRREDTKKENRKSKSSRFHIGSDGLCKLSIHNETASLAVIESTDL